MMMHFLCTAHKPLSQRLYLAHLTTHDVSVEYALPDKIMVSAYALAHPDLIICAFITMVVLKEVYNIYSTLIIQHTSCIKDTAADILRAMTLMSPIQAQAMGLVYCIFRSGPYLDDRTRFHISMLTRKSNLKREA
ncbi:hypothetical protein LTR74_016908 [Friedmanniomyces endolithicus]|nr:hypothetical protein LTR74_016908 [Friedmanniomyces endolithicus]